MADANPQRPRGASLFFSCLRAGFASALLLVLTGCASAPKDGPGIVGRALEKIGIGKPEDQTPAEQRPKVVPVRLYAGANLNAGNDKQPLALVVRVYRLRDRQRFEQASFNAFLDDDTEQAALGDDLLSVTEIVLQPGQRHEITDRLPPEAGTIGIVGLFRSPAQGRWRLAFDATEAQKDGVTIGLHACALTTASPSLQTRVSGQAHSLTHVQCGTN